jgi:uncharacterized membrane protein
VTPRATRLLMEDTTSQNVLGTFIGSFLFSLVGIVALSTGLYGSQGRAILLVVTIALIALIAITILRWIDYLARFGRLGETIERVERATWTAMEARLAHPHLGGRPLIGGAPDSARPVFAETVGYVQHVDVVALEAGAKSAGCEIYVTALPGAFVDPSRPVAMSTRPARNGDGSDADAHLVETIRNAFTLGAERTFDQDPRFGLCVLAEIAQRALSPAINDPGTAIDVIGRAVRLLVQWSRFDAAKRDRDVSCPHVWVPEIAVGDMFDDIFQPIARDGAAMLEVHIRLQKAFLALAATDREAFGDAVRRHATAALKRAEDGLKLEEEKQVVQMLAAEIGAPVKENADPGSSGEKPTCRADGTQQSA